MKYYITVFIFYFVSVLSAGSFIQRNTIQCGDSMIIEGLGYPIWNPASFHKHAEYGYDKIIKDDLNRQKLVYYAPICSIVLDTVIVICARATQISCDTGYYIFEVDCSNMGLFDISKHIMKCNDTLIVENLSAFQAPEITMNPSYGQSKLLFYPTDGAALWYLPIKNYEGPDYVKVKLRTGRTWLYVIHVRCEKSTLVDDLIVDKDVSFQFNDELLTILSSSKINYIQLFSADGKEQNYKIAEKSDHQHIFNISNPFNQLLFGIIRTDKGFRNLKMFITK